MTALDLPPDGADGKEAAAGSGGGTALPMVPGSADYARQLADALASDDDGPTLRDELLKSSADMRGQDGDGAAGGPPALLFAPGPDTPEVRAQARKATQRYLHTLDPTATRFDFRAIDERKGRGLPTKLFTNATLDEAWPELWRLNQLGYGIFVMVNATDGRGQKGANVIRVRAVVADCDGVDPSALVAAMPPHMAVRTSHGKCHLYWLASDCALDQFTPLHKALIAKYDTDKAVHDLPRVLRLPGFYHNKAEPRPVRFASALVPKTNMELPAYSVQEIIDGLGLDVDPAAPRSTAANDASSRKAKAKAGAAGGASGTSTLSPFDFGPQAALDATPKLPPPPETPEWIGWVEGALAKLDPDCGRVEWRAVVWGLMATLWDETAKRLLRAWSARAKEEKNRGQDGLELLLKGYDPNRPDAKRFGTFVQAAKDAGYSVPRPGGGSAGQADAAQPAEAGQPAAGDASAATAAVGDRTTLAHLQGSSDDTWNGRRFAQRWRGRLRFVPAQDERVAYWLIFDPACGWRAADHGEVERAAMECVEAMVGEVSALTAQHGGDVTHSSVKKLSGQLRYSRKATAVAAMIRLGRTQPGMYSGEGAFDGDPMHLGVANGVLDLSTGALLPLRPDLMVRLRCGVPFDPAATCPTFERFLSRMQPDLEQRAFLRRWLFYCLTGRFAEKKFLFHHGPDGNNGKSTMLEVFASMVGDYARKIATESLMEHKRNAQSHDADLAVIRNKRFLFASETRLGQRLSSDRIKDLTGGDTVVARRPHEKEALQLKPTYKLSMYGNHLPVIDDPSRAMWSRVLVLEWNVVISEADVDFDPHLRDKLLAEAPGLLTWVLGARVEYLERGLAPPPAVLAAAESYRKEENTIAAFVAEKCRSGQGMSIEKDRLYLAFANWWKDQGHTSEPGTNKMFTRRIGKEGFPVMPDKKRIGGLCLTSDPSDVRSVTPLRAV